MRPNDMRIAYVINSVEGGGAASPVPDIADVIHGTGAKIRIFALTRRDGRALDAIAKAGIDVVVRNGGLKDHVAAFRCSYGQLHSREPVRACCSCAPTSPIKARRTGSAHWTHG